LVLCMVQLEWEGMIMLPYHNNDVCNQQRGE
jgi:hypothetical protein